MSNPTPRGTALITGASSGIGAIYAQRLAARGYDLVLVARNRARLDTLATRLAAETGRKVEVLEADLTQKPGMLRVEERLQKDAAITMLVNNAGFGSAAPLLQSDPDRLEEMIVLNVTALTRLARAVGPAFVARGKGTIVNISSIVALAPELLNGTYSGSKAYVLSLTQALHAELSPKGVRVQAVLPGATRTEFWDIAGHSADQLPQEWVMEAGDMVDAALAGLDAGELVTIPALPAIEDWEKFNAARLALGPGLSRSQPAARYNVK
jgi:short-subunit dehydrogenase